jgi:hypothetical protein
MSSGGTEDWPHRSPDVNYLHPYLCGSIKIAYQKNVKTQDAFYRRILDAPTCVKDPTILMTSFTDIKEYVLGLLVVS